ncbi:lycopene cyclase family protein [Algoriphagus namhaensis]
MKRVDYIIAGAGCAGLSLVYHMLQSPLKEAQIVIIDPCLGEIPNKTWCYWSDSPLDIHPANALKSWSKLNLNLSQPIQNLDLGALNYYHLSSAAFFQSIYQLLHKSPQVTLIKSEVKDLEEWQNGAIATLSDGRQFKANYAFDSRRKDSDFDQKNLLKQIFLGWKIKCDNPIFTKESITLMEQFRPNRDQFDFFYILPYSDTEALVEYTVYSSAEIPKDQLKQKLLDYLAHKTKKESYQVTFEEFGMIPMTTKIKDRPTSEWIINLGTKAGWSKASTGYTFHQIQRSTQQMVQDLLSAKGKISVQRKSRRFHFYDNILLNIISKWPQELHLVFEDLFSKNKTDKVLRFLNEDTSLWEEFTLLGKLKYRIFLKSLFRYAQH